VLPIPEYNNQTINQASTKENLTFPVFDIVALTASAHGLDALTQVLSPLPADFPAAIVVVQHLSPKYPSLVRSNPQPPDVLASQ
jgi:two-component system chemotaxis response regulator CheB